LPYLPIFSVFRLVRWPNLLILALTQYLSYFTFFPHITVYELFDLDFLSINIHYISASTLLIAASGYTINDIYDQKIDRINKPKTRIIGRKLSVSFAIKSYILLVFSALFMAACIDTRLLMINSLSIFLLWFYSHSLKKHPLVGNILIAALAAFSILILTLLPLPYSDRLYSLAILAFFSHLIREITKDIEDLLGDLLGGRRSMIIVWGFKTTTRVLVFLNILFMSFMSFTAWNSRQTSYLLFFGLFIGYQLLWTQKLLEARHKYQFGQLSFYAKLGMIMGLLYCLL
jgi:4-hydroxybenzoate polyprenyltransferase